MTSQQDFRSTLGRASKTLLTEIDLILSKVISSLADPQDVSALTIETTRQQLERVRASLITLSSHQPTPDPVRWYLGIDSHVTGLSVVFFKEVAGTIDLYPLSWNLESGTSDRLPSEYVDFYLIDWLTHLPPNSESWLAEALQDLAGIILSRPGEMKIDTLESAILAAKLTDNPDKIHSIEATIALALAYVPIDPLPHPETLLVVHSGEKMTELALLEIPIDPCTLSRQMIALSRFTYGKRSFAQDILVQLIYPHWSAFFPSSFPTFEIPQAGSVDESPRERLRTQLETHPLGKPLQEAAQLTRLILEERSELTSQVTEHLWTVNREDLETRVIAPFIATLQREIDNLLEKRQTNRSDLTQIIFSGDLFANNWPLLSTRLTAQFYTDITIHPPSTEDIAPVVIGLGRFPLYPSLGSKSGNND